MKIGVVGTLWNNTPPDQYGGTEDVIFNLVNGLVDQGHDVTLFGPATARTKAKLVPTIDLPLRQQGISWDDMTHHFYHYTEAFDNADQFDVLHVHINRTNDYIAFPLAQKSTTPVLFTIHFTPNRYRDMPDRKVILDKYAHFPFISISNAQRVGMPLHYLRTVYNALRIAEYPFSDTSDDYFVWLGKIKPEKGTKEAIQAAIQSNEKLVIMGNVDEDVPALKAYFENDIKPLLNHSNITYIGPADLPTKVKYLSRAKAMLNPIQWDEPFGLVMAEAQAVGTPVIASDRGAAGEVIDDGATGFLVKNVDEMVEKMTLVDQIDRAACRKHIEQKFSIQKMIDGYIASYIDTIKSWESLINNKQRLYR